VGCNAVELTGRLKTVEPLRHTPSGVPLLHFIIAHESIQIEAGHERRVECEVPGVALGEPATRMARFGVGDEVRVTGFLSRRNRMSVQLRLHATQTELVKDRDHA
jgi:primosomal replication protein N